jgi:hypothetical protein
VIESFQGNLLGQLQKKGFSIDAGLAVDARLARSVSTPVSKDKIEEKKQEREQRKQDTTKKSLKFCRDLESDWMKRREIPFYGMKEHASIDVKSGLLMSTLLSKASEHDSNYFQYTVGVTALHQGAGQARFTTLVKEGWDRLCHAIAFNIKRSYITGVSTPPVPASST